MNENLINNKFLIIIIGHNSVCVNHDHDALNLLFKGKKESSCQEYIFNSTTWKPDDDLWHTTTIVNKKKKNLN